MKSKLLTALIVLVIAFGLASTDVNAIKLYVAGDYGPMVQTGSRPIMLWSIGLDAPLISINDKGVTIVNETGTLWGGEGEGEVLVMRTMFDTYKNIISKPILGSDGEISDWSYRLYLITGIGGWKFIETGAEDNEMLAYHVGIGFGLSGLDGGVDLTLSLNCDIVRAPGDDIFRPTVNATLGL